MRVVERLDFPGNSDALKAALLQARQFVAQHGGFGPHPRREEHHTLPARFAQHPPDTVVQRMRFDPAPVLRTELHSLQRPEEAGIICQLRHRRNGRARRTAAGALLDGKDR